MLNSKEQLDKLRALATPVCEAHGLALVDARFSTEQGGLVLRVLIERADQPDGNSGVSLGDCQTVSRDLSTLLDVEADPFIPGRYRLEVGSPGLDRPLFTPDDYRRFAGREVRVKTSRPVAGRKQLEGVLQGLAGENIKLNLGGEELSVPLAEITKANLVFRF